MDAQGRPDLVSRFARVAATHRGMLALLALAAVLRLPGLAQPITGNFATKQAVYGMIARNWAEGRAGWWQPRVDCLRGGQRGLHLLEVPLAAYLAGAAWKTLGGSLETWGRLVAVAFSLGSVWLLFVLVRRRFVERTALAAAAVMALAPVSVIYGQSFMLEASVVFWTLLVLTAIQGHLDRGGHWWPMVAGGAWMALLATKVYMAVLVAPLAICAVQHLGRAATAQRRRVLGLAAALVVASLPPAAWCGYALHAGSAPATAPQVYYSLAQSRAVHGLPHPLLQEPTFYAGLAGDLATVVLTPVGLLLALYGTAQRGAKQLVPWLAAAVLLVLLLPLKFHRMNYYWLPLLPPLCVLVGLGINGLLQRLVSRRAVAPAVAMILIAALAGSLRWSVGPVWRAPRREPDLAAAGRAIDQWVAPHEPLLTLHGSSVDLLYYCDRAGWAMSAETAAAEAFWAPYAAQQARFLVAAGTDVPPAVERLPCVQRGEGFAVYRLPAASPASERFTTASADRRRPRGPRADRPTGAPAHPVR